VAAWVELELNTWDVIASLQINIAFKRGAFDLDDVEIALSIH
jgi:hypothetical protein